MKIIPKRGEVLLEMEPESETDGGIVIPEKAQEKPQFGRVVRIGPWRFNKRGLGIIPLVRVGDRVIVNKYVGRNLDVKPPMKLVPEERIMAVLT